MSPRRAAAGLVAALVASLTVSACSGELYREDIEGSESDTPASYRHLRNPYSDARSLEAAAVGQTLYDARCAECHGDRGRGDGRRSAGMVPAPTDFVPLSQPSDGYLYWRIREGGEEQGTDMPAWKEQLTDEQIWAIVTYVQLFYQEEPLYR